uniref:Gag-pol protein n=1 Tax=Oryza sativa subsp. japonica TaxID=39947 RepID=Q75K41_ORYSJ|nr:putative gag-pol protein [Oryza sativa Japonica Group]
MAVIFQLGTGYRIKIEYLHEGSVGAPRRGSVKFLPTKCDGFRLQHRRLRLPPGQAFRFGSLNFITNNFGKLSLLDSDSNQSGRNQVLSPFGIPNSADVYSKIVSPELVSNHSDEIQSTPQRPDQDDGSYPSILMRLPDDLATVFTAKASPVRRSRRASASAPIQSRSREVGVILQSLGTVSTEELDGYLSSPDVSSRPTEILDYGDFDNFDDSYEDNYTPLFCGVFMADNETEEQRRAREADEERTRQETERRRLEEERQRQERERLQHEDHDRCLASSQLRKHPHPDWERRVERPHSPHRRRPVDLRDTINQLRAARGNHSPDRYDDDMDGVAAFTSELRRVDWPADFKPTGIEKYDGTTNPESWLTVYGLAVRAVGGDSKAMANYLPVALADSARSWLHGLPRGTIGSWAELRDHFIANFQGTFERPGTHFDLYNIVQKSGESLRDYIRRFSKQRNKISDITDDVIIAAFTKGIRHEDLVGKFGRKPPKTVKQMFEKANEYAKAEDAITASKQSGTTWKPKKDTPTAGGSGSNNHSNNHKDRKRKPEELVAITSPSSRQRSRVNTFNKIMNSQCLHHPNSNHVAKDCFVYKQFAEQYVKNARKPSDGDQGTSNKKDDEDDAPTGFQDHRKELNHIFGGPLSYESKRKQKLTEREINAVQPNTPQDLRWSEIAIKFDRSDHPDRVVHPGRYPLNNKDIFAWKPSDMPGIPREVIEHSLHVKEDTKPIKQRLRRFAQDMKDAIKEELTKLLAAGFIKEVLHPDWLANPVLVRKKTGQWRMCVDYTDLNKSCPKDPFGLPRIDQVIDSTAGCELLSFLDCYSGYHQIRLKESDCLKTSFITPFGAYCYITMPFGLKNAGATYQRMIQRCFSTQIGRNVEAYVDDVVIKTKQKDDLIADLEETFASIRAFRMKLNPEKCIFRVPSGKLLRFMWGPEAEKAFPDFKKLLTTPPVLASPRPQEPLLLYVSGTSQVVSMVLVVEREEEGHIQKVQRPIYFVSDVLANSKTRYPQVQKLLYGVLITVRKLSHYFQSHSVTVVTSFPLGDILHNREANGRIAKWALELMPLDISFKPRTLIKSQALADYLTEWTEYQEDMPEEKMEYWTMHFDGSKRLTGAGAGVVLISPTGERLSYVLWIHFSASHNMAEYEALLHGLRIAISLGIRRLIVRGDSQLVVNQVMKEWSCQDDNMTAYRQEVRKLEDKFDGLELTHVLRHNNEAADRLANFGSKREAIPSDVFVEHLYEPTVPRKEKIEAMNTQGVSMIEADWREPLIRFLTKQELPQDKNEAEQISRRSRLYVIHKTELYKKSPSGILQRCVSLEEGRQLQKDIHSGICGNHAAARTIVGKAYRQGFFWPKAVSDADKIVRTCEGCQFFARQTHLPAQELQTIPLSWPFALWKKFSKWIEAKPVVTITANKARDFFINIVHRFGVPNRIITDNGTQFTGGIFKDFCEDFGIKICYASVSHPMSNGQVKRANGMVLQGIKARVFDRLHPYTGKWVEQLPSVLWSLRTTPSRATGQSPFFLVYGAEAMLPSEVEFESLRFCNFREERYEEDRVDDINRLEEAREAVLIQSARYLQGLRHYHNRNVRSRAFLVGDLVLRRIQTTQDRHKLSPLWEGPFIIAEVTRPGSYRLKREDGTLVNNSWNIEHLRRFYA